MSCPCSAGPSAMAGSSGSIEARVKIAIRADASPRIGAGHVMRCLALADGLRARGAEVMFVCRHVTESLQRLIAEKGHRLTRLEAPPDPVPERDAPHSAWLGVPQEADAAQTLQVLAGATWDWVVVDHYALDHRWETAVRASASRILVIDDLADRVHDCDLLLDQNLYRGMGARYAGKAPDTAELRLGPRYALLRASFAAQRSLCRPRSGAVRRLLILFGGVDADDHTGAAVEIVASLALQGVAVDVVVGGEHPRRDALAGRCQALGFRIHVQTPHIAELMAQADLAIGAAGSATWERCCLGLPTIAFAVADNQVEVLDHAAEQGLLWAAGRDGLGSLARDLEALMANEPLRRHLSHAGFDAVDGLGVARIATDMGCTAIALRSATMADARDLFDWRNHPSIRAVSRESQPIEWERHEQWLASTLGDPRRILLLGHAGDRPVGVVRFDREGDTAEVSIYLVPGAQEPGAGRELLAAAEAWFSRQHPDVKRLTAAVLGSNERSHGLFRSRGYHLDASAYSKGLP